MRKRALLLIIAVLAFFLTALFYRHFSQFPAGLSELHEYSWNQQTIPYDFLYLLKARVTKSDFDQYIRQKEFVPLSEKKIFSFPINQRKEPQWWDPSDDVDNAYCHPEQATSEDFIYVKFEKGYFYYAAGAF